MGCKMKLLVGVVTPVASIALAFAISGCSSGPGHLPTARPQSNGALFKESGQLPVVQSPLPLSPALVDEKSDPARVELDGVYPELRKLRTRMIVAHWKDASFWTPFRRAG